MQVLPSPLVALSASFRNLPGVGARTALRMAMHMAKTSNHAKARQLAEDLVSLCENLRLCAQCRNYATEELCQVCQSPSRNDHQLCVVETPTDLVAVENSGGYHGRYFVLHGKLSPIDGIGPEHLGFDLLEKQLHDSVSEVILALGTTVEGNVTCHYLQQRLQRAGLQITRPAQGIPAGGSVELLDSVTLGQAMMSRQMLDNNSADE